MIKRIVPYILTATTAVFVFTAPAFASERFDAAFAVTEAAVELQAAETAQAAAQAVVTATTVTPAATLVAAQQQHTATAEAIAATEAAGITDPTILDPMNATLAANQLAVDQALRALNSAAPAATAAQTALVSTNTRLGLAEWNYDVASNNYAALLNAGFAAQIADEQAVQDAAIVVASAVAGDAKVIALHANALATANTETLGAMMDVFEILCPRLETARYGDVCESLMAD